MKIPCMYLYYQGSPKISLTGPILGSIWGLFSLKCFCSLVWKNISDTVDFLQRARARKTWVTSEYRCVNEDIMTISGCRQIFLQFVPQLNSWYWIWSKSQPHQNQPTPMLQVLDWLVLLRNCDVQILWTLQGVEWFDGVHVVSRLADPRVQSNNNNSSNLTKLNNKNKLSVYFNPGHNLDNKW